MISDRGMRCSSTLKGIAPLMIILRVANGIAYSDRTASELTHTLPTDTSGGLPTMHFASQATAPTPIPGATHRLAFGETGTGTQMYDSTLSGSDMQVESYPEFVKA